MPYRQPFRSFIKQFWNLEETRITNKENKIVNKTFLQKAFKF